MLRWALLYTLVTSSSCGKPLASAAAFLHPCVASQRRVAALAREQTRQLVVASSAQQRERLHLDSETKRAMQNFLRLRAGRLLSLSARAAFAASAGSYALPNQHESKSLSRTRSKWLSPSHPALSRAAAPSGACAADATGAARRTLLRFREGPSREATDG